MSPRFLNGVVIPGTVFLGILAGLSPAPAAPALWVGTLFYNSVALWMFVRSYGWATTSLYAVIVIAGFFGAEYVAVNSLGLLSHRTCPQLAGVSVLALIQDFYTSAFVFALAAALTPAGGAIARGTAAGTVMLVVVLVTGPWVITWEYYSYRAPFTAWPASLGMAQVPAVPWEEPIGFVLYAVVTTLVFEGVRRWRGLSERPFSLKWTSVVFYGFIVVPGWVWAANQRHWPLFALGAVLLAEVGVLITWRGLAGRRRAATGAGQ
jgi:hypothetical protein